jgi:hypothetical protein
MMSTCATRLTNASKTKTLALDDVQGHDGDVQGPQGPTSIWKIKVPLGLGRQGASEGNALLFPCANLQFLLTPGWGCSIHLWALSLHEGPS